MSTHSIIGIDFGTNKTLVARWDAERKLPVMVRLRPASGDDMPTFAHVNAEGVMVFGDEAGEQGIVDSKGFITAFKRDLGRDAAPFLLHSYDYSARQLVCAYLRWIRELVERESLHAAVDHAVITVPAGWLQTPRQELLDAAKDAGFASVELLDEPVAAGIAFMRSRGDLWPEGAVLVLDWGAGTLDLAVLTTKNGQPHIIPELVSGKAGLGGKDIDDHLMRMMNKRLIQLGLPRLERRPEEEHELARRRVIDWKIKHGSRPGAVWRIDGLSEVPADADLSWTSEEIAKCVGEKLQEAVKACGEVLTQAKSRGIMPTGLLLIGGTSQFPAFKVLLEESFPELRILPWEQRISAVALGGAWHAAARVQLTELTPELGNDEEVTRKDGNPLGMNFVPVSIIDGPKLLKTVFFGEYPVRVKDYEAFIKETGRAWNKPSFSQTSEHPVVCVHWHDAKAWCEWLSKKSKSLGVRFRLPTDHEWSCAAGLGALESPADSYAKKMGNPQTAGVYVWGRFWPPPYGAFLKEEYDPGVPFKSAVSASFDSSWGTRGNDGYAALGTLSAAAVGLGLLSMMFFSFSASSRRAYELARQAQQEKWGILTGAVRLFSGPSDYSGIHTFFAVVLLIAAICALVFLVVVIMDAIPKIKPPKRTPGIPNYPNKNPNTSPVGAHQATAQGLYDLSGNVWEWTADAWTGIADEKALRGGAWSEHQPDRIASSYRDHRPSTAESDAVGFRCVMERVAT